MTAEKRSEAVENVKQLCCPECGESKLQPVGPIVPVWEDPADYDNGNEPDYLGCTDCHVMTEVRV